ncbi:MAG: SH3 domain-containing protein [Caldilineaceae bacterium]|nr:SH3 domain-containing protein [Caldilineaceae bacterium]
MPPAQSRTGRHPIQITSLLLAALVTLSGCGLFAAADDSAGPLAIRTPQPTFTPTVAAAPATEAPPATTTDAATTASSNPASGQGDLPKAVINTPLLNARSGPSTDFEVVATIERGAEYDIVGVSPDRSWWQICCIDGVEVWVTNEFVDTLGLVDSVPVIGGAATTQPTAPAAAAATAPPAAVPATATPQPAPAATFILETQEQFPETGVVRVFLYVYSGNSALEGYSLSVTKDGTALPVEGSSFGGQPAFTWPFQDPRQRFQNFKVEYPETPPQGTWQVQLIDNTGATVGPPATFTLSSNDPQQELYVRYAQQ